MRNGTTMPTSTKVKVLIYGFEPWGDTPYNISGELIKSKILQEELVSIGLDLDVYDFAILPVRKNALREYMDLCGKRYSAFIGIGSSDKTSKVTIEKWFTNDFEGSPVIHTVSHKTPVPSNIAPEIGEFLHFGNGTSCGTFVCNASALIGFDLAEGESGFIHIPKQDDNSAIDILVVAVARSIRAMKISRMIFYSDQNHFYLAPKIQKRPALEASPSQ